MVLNSLTISVNPYLEPPVFIRGAKVVTTKNSCDNGVFDPGSDMGRWLMSLLAGLAAP